MLGWGFLRLLLRLQLRRLSRGVPSSHLEKDERLILGHICIYSWKRHALCYAVFGYARNRWLNTLYGIVWETKYGRFTTLNIPKCEHFTLLSCLSIAASGDFCHETAKEMYKVSKHTCFAFELFAMNATPAKRVTPSWQVYMANCHPADRVTLPGRPGNPPKRVTHLSCKRDQNKIRNYMERWGYLTYLGSPNSM